MTTIPQRDQLTLSRLFPPGSANAHTVIRSSGRRARTVYRSGGAVVGEIHWDRWGWHPRRTSTPRWQLEYHEGGALSLAVPLLDGQIHGHTAQWTPGGTLLVSCRFVHGTGTDFFCCVASGRLLEAHPYRSGRPHGWERWWRDARSLSEEIHWVDGRRHGPHRRWSGGEVLVRLFVAGQLVTRPAYLDAAQADPTLPALSDEARLALRAVPGGFVRRVSRPAPWEE